VRVGNYKTNKRAIIRGFTHASANDDGFIIIVESNYNCIISGTIRTINELDSRRAATDGSFHNERYRADGMVPFGTTPLRGRLYHVIQIRGRQ
jgi:hypothetical protein